VPLQLATLFGIVIAQLSALAAIMILVLTAAGAVHPSVWVWVLSALLFLSGVQLTTVGILGRYMARVHAEVLGRPLYLVDLVDGPASTPQPPTAHPTAEHADPRLEERRASAPIPR
jgi:polyisoprenyl-phosphate glycosyltransferase